MYYSSRYYKSRYISSHTPLASTDATQPIRPYPVLAAGRNSSPLLPLRRERVSVDLFPILHDLASSATSSSAQTRLSWQPFRKEAHLAVPVHMSRQPVPRPRRPPDPGHGALDRDDEGEGWWKRGVGGALWCFFLFNCLLFYFFVLFCLLCCYCLLVSFCVSVSHFEREFMFLDRENCIQIDVLYASGRVSNKSAYYRNSCYRITQSRKKDKRKTK